jgi:hypothetical protein
VLSASTMVRWNSIRWNLGPKRRAHQARPVTGPFLSGLICASGSSRSVELRRKLRR